MMGPDHNTNVLILELTILESDDDDDDDENAEKVK